MKIAFWGSDSFAFPILEKLLEKHQISVVICQPDKTAGRNRRLTEPETKTWAIKKGIPVLQPEILKHNHEVLAQLKGYNCDLSLVISYGKIIPKMFLEATPLGAINLHGSLLPVLRGASPIQSALLQGMKRTGVTVQFMTSKMDAGDIIDNKALEIDDSWDYGQLRQALSLLGRDLLPGVLEKMEKGTIQARAQVEEEATYCYKIDPRETIIHWNNSAQEIRNMVRSFSPSPGARTWFKGKMIKLYLVNHFTDLESIAAKIPSFSPADLPTKSFVPGQVLWARKGNLIVASLHGYLEIVNLQPENKKIMKAQDFINGFRPEFGDLFTNGE